MYIDNPKKLFDDLIKIETMYDYMVAVEEDGQQDDLENLISIVYHHKDELWESGGRGEGSSRWDLAQFEFEPPEERRKYRRKLYNDSRKLKKIWATLQKEAAEKGYKDRWGHL